MTQTAIRQKRSRRAHASQTVDAAPRTSAPVKWWAAVGAVYLVFMVAVLTRWVISPLFKTVPVGPTPVPNGLLEPQDVTDSIMHLISDAGRYITGTTYVMDAGFTNNR